MVVNLLCWQLGTVSNAKGPVLLDDFPHRINSWVGTDISYPEDSLEQRLEAQGMLFRSYRDADRVVEILMVTRDSSSRVYHHRPEMCLPGAGFAILDRRVRSFRAGGRTIQATYLLMGRREERTVCLYWYASKDDTTSSYAASRLLMARDRVLHHKGNWTFDVEQTGRWIDLSRKHGLADRPTVVSFGVEHWYSVLVDRRGLGSHLRLVRPDVPESFFAEVTRMVEAIENERKRRGWPEFLYYPIDEPSTEEKSVRFMVGVLRAIKQVPGVRTYVTADPTHDQFAPMWPYVDVWCCQPFVFDCEKIRRLSREKKIEFWCYPNHISGENDHTPIRGARMTWGFGFWRSGFKALIPWIYQSSSGDPWNYLDGPSMDFFNRSTPDGEPVPVAMWEAYREGIDDGRYIFTLEQLIAEGKRKGGAAAEAAARAETELKRVWDSIEVQEKYKHDRLWRGADFDAYRWLLATQIMELSGK